MPGCCAKAITRVMCQASGGVKGSRLSETVAMCPLTWALMASPVWPASLVTCWIAVSKPNSNGSPLLGICVISGPQSAKCKRAGEASGCSTVRVTPWMAFPGLRVATNAGCSGRRWAIAPRDTTRAAREKMNKERRMRVEE